MQSGSSAGQMVDHEVEHLDGWHDWERHSYFHYRWMGREAAVRLSRSVLQLGRFVSLPIFSPFEDSAQTLTLSHEGGAPLHVALRPGWHIYDVPLADVGAAPARAGSPVLRFAVEPLFPQERHPGDMRELGVAIGIFEVHDDGRRHEYVQAFAQVAVPGPLESAEALHEVFPEEEGRGWYSQEVDDEGLFRWMAREAEVDVPEPAAAARFCEIPAFSEFNNLGQELTVLADGLEVGRFQLLKRWSRYSVAMPRPRRDGRLTLTFRVNRLMPAASHPQDARALGVRIGTLVLHDDEARHEATSARLANDVRRHRELLTGATVLSSTPSTLGIDLFGKCNIKPACVYCPWDRMKALEGANTNAPIDDQTLESYGGIYRQAASLVNCSFGEPLLHPRIEQILELVTRNRQTIELSTNGQAFTPRTIRALAGAPVHLYVSLDAATHATYARLRNDRWYEVLAGLLALRDARLRAGKWPHLNLVYIPMAANRSDLEDYFKLCRLVDADRLVLRPLLMEESQVDVERAGYRFVYLEQHLGSEGLARLAADCRLFSERYGVAVMTQFDFGKTDFGRLETAAAHGE